MICSSLARNRSPDPVVACCFGRIVPSDAAKESWFRLKENQKTKLQPSAPSGCKTLQSQTAQSPKNRLTFNRLSVNHGRLVLLKRRRTVATIPFLRRPRRRVSTSSVLDNNIIWPQTSLIALVHCGVSRFDMFCKNLGIKQRRSETIID
jgi:hypothetical protein